MIKPFRRLAVCGRPEWLCSPGSSHGFSQLCLCGVPQSCLTLCNPMDCSRQAPLSMGILWARILEWAAISSSRGIFPTQGLNPVLPHCRQILYGLSHQGSPRILDCVAYPFFRGVLLTQELNQGLLHAGLEHFKSRCHTRGEDSFLRNQVRNALCWVSAY